MNIQQMSARYQAARPKDAPIDLVVIHATAGRRGGDIPTLAGLTSRVVSCHYYVQKDGVVIQFVDERREAWHAGASSWPLFATRGGSLNWRSIGIELENLNNGVDPYTDVQIERCAELVRGICGRWDIPLTRRHIVGHYEISPGRKTDPRGLDLDDLVRRASRWVPPQPKGWVVEVLPELPGTLNIRQGPHTKYPIVAVLQPGERVVVDTTKDEGQGEWLHLADHRGFISGAYTKRVTPQPEGWVVEVTADSLNIRQGANTSYPVVAQLRRGERVVVDATKDEGQGTWLHLADHRGFISAAYTRRV